MRLGCSRWDNEADLWNLSDAYGWNIVWKKIKSTISCQDTFQRYCFHFLILKSISSLEQSTIFKCIKEKV